TARRLTHNRPQPPLLAGRPDIAAFGDGALFVAYDQDLESGQAGVQHGLYSPDGGQYWALPLQLGRSPEETHGAVAALGSNGVAAWFEQRSGRNFGIHARLTLDSGKTWIEEERVSLPESAGSTPHVALTPGYLHVIWLGPRDG